MKAAATCGENDCGYRWCHTNGLNTSTFGCRDETVTKSYFEEGILCVPPLVSWDDEGDVWEGCPLATCRHG